MYVKDHKGLSDWYCNTFGLKTLHVDDEARWVEVDMGRGVVLAFHGGGNKRTWTRPPQIMFEVADAEQAKASLEAAGTRMGKIGRWKHVVWCHGKDPEGNPFQITEKA